MTWPPPDNALNPFSAVALLAAFVVHRQLLMSHLGVSIDHPDVCKFTDDYWMSLIRQYDRKIRAEALRKFRRWRKADVPNLLLLPGPAREATQRAVRRLLLHKNKPGKGVIAKPKSFEEAFFEALSLAQRMADPAISAKERRRLHKHMPTHAALIEAAHRGELKKAKRQMTDKRLPYRKASEHTEENVAEAAGISRSVVHQLCQRARDEYKSAARWAAARPGRGVELEPAMTAADLKRHLDQPARLAKLSKP